jgi:hypothetical protein
VSAVLRPSPVNAGLALLSLLLAVLLALDLDGMAGTHVLVAAPSLSAGVAGGAAAAGTDGSIDSFRAITERPLFAASRRAPSVAPVAMAAPIQAAAAPPSFQLVGIVGAGDVRLVLVRKPNAPIQRLQPGQSLDGWQLVEVGADRAIFANGGSRTEIKLARRGAAEQMPVSEPWLSPTNGSPR